MNNNKQWIYGLMGIFTCLVIILSSACSKDDDLPHNPYDDVNYNTGGQQDTTNPASITGIHKNILLPKCAVPGCHDGAFEPDYRSVQSSYSTLVYHKIIKNNTNNDFTFRVVPFDTALSVLHERITNCCFVNQDDRMPQDNIGVPLPQEDIDNISTWIMNGARDIDGNVPKYPNLEPYLRDAMYVAVDDGIPPTILYSDLPYRKDSLLYNPFEVPNNINIVLVFYPADDSTTVQDLTVNQVKMSLDPDDFSVGWTANASYITFPPDEVYTATIATGPLPKDTTIFFRYYMNDGDHTQNTEIPKDGWAYEYKTYFSFRVKP